MAPRRRARSRTPLGRCEPTEERFIIYDAHTPKDPSTPPPSLPASLRLPTGDLGAVPATPTASQLSSLHPPSLDDSSGSYDATSSVGTKRPRSHQDIVTPQKRANSKGSLSEAAKSRISAASQKATLKQEDDGRLYCMVTGLQDFMLPLEFSHILPRSTSAEVLTKLEWVWNMGYGHLNLNTRYNIQILTEALHTLFDHRRAYWFWLPLDSNLIVNLHLHYVGANKAENGRWNIKQLYPTKPDEFPSFKYALIVPQYLERSIAFFRFQGEIPMTPVDKAKSLTYEPIEPTDLHLSPHYVIYDIGRKLEARYKDSVGWEGIRARFQEEVEFNDPVYWEQLQMCYEIYEVWMAAEPTAAFSQATMPELTFLNLTAEDFVDMYREVVVGTTKEVA